MPNRPGQGRKPRPTALHILEGTARDDRGAKNEPKSTPGMPVPPAWLTPAAKRKYRAMGAQLVRLGVMTETDGDALARYASDWVRMIDAEQKLAQFGDVIIVGAVRGADGKIMGGELRMSPYLRVLNACHDRLGRLASDFGLTPSSRSRIHALPALDADDPAAEFAL